MNCLKSKSRNSETSENEYIVKNDKIKEYEKLKTCLIRKKKILKILEALGFSLLTILKVGFYYLDIVTDIQLSVKYFEASNIKNSNKSTNNTSSEIIEMCTEQTSSKQYYWYGVMTLSILIFSLIVNWIGLFYTSRLKFKYNWSRQKYKEITFKAFSILFQLEMFNW